MASVAYSIQNVFSVPAKAEQDVRAIQQQSNGSSQSEAEVRGGSYVNLAEQLKASQRNGESRNEFEGNVGSSHALHLVLEQIRIVARTDSTVLIEGETGTGKELIASAIHSRSHRRGRPLVKLNCAAIPLGFLGLLESELFGQERGAFTGAAVAQKRIGREARHQTKEKLGGFGRAERVRYARATQKMSRFEAANGGTLFLDQIGDIPLELQSKLLRVLQEQEFERLGSAYTRRVDVRVAAATNQDLAGLIADKQFRMDLYYRLNVFPMTLPTLRLGMDDIPMLVAHFVQKFGERMSKQISKSPKRAMDTLMRFSRTPIRGIRGIHGINVIRGSRSQRISLSLLLSNTCKWQEFCFLLDRSRDGTT